MKRLVTIALTLLFSLQARTADIPGAMIRSADSLAPLTYELMLSPQYIFSDGGSYLSTELRYQPNEELGVGFGFGSGEIGYHTGAYAVWHIFPDLADQPAFSVLAGLYFNRVTEENYFAMRVAPQVSETFTTEWGQVTPYGAIQVSPSFRLGEANNDFSIRANMGSQLTVDQFRGLSLWMEVGINLVDSFSQIAFGLSYPFADFG